jgi:hypothetical protein
MILSLDAIWNFDRDRAFLRGIRLWGIKGLTVRPRCIETVRGRTHYKSSTAF